MGRPKLVLPWRGRAIISDVVERARTAASDVVVVTGHDAAATADELTGRDIQIINNPDYAAGEMISSVKTGVAALPRTCEAFFLVLGDQPGIAAETFDQLLAAWRSAAQGAMILSPTWNNRRGHPVLISAAAIDEILALPADATLKTFVTRYADRSIEVEVADPAILADVDTPEQYRRLTEMQQTETGSLSCPTETIAAD
jgi:molybdenum cofactor cytidylyltransferase